MAGGKVREYQINAQGGVSSVTWIDTPTASSGSVAWGDITGTVANQTDISTLYALTTHTHSASNITASTLALARLGGGTYNVSTFLSGASSFSQPSYSSLANLPTLGTAASTAASDYSLSSHGHNASQVSSSTFALARMGTGSPNVSTFLDGTGAWSQPVYGSLSGLPTLGTAASTAASDYALSSHFHAADRITTSTFALARIAAGTYNASTYLSGTSTFNQPSYSSLANLPTLGTAASTAAANYASSTHNISSATHTFPGNTSTFLRADGTFQAPTASAAWGSITGDVSSQTDISTMYALTTHTHSASNINASTFAVARLAAGSANVSTFPDGTGNWSVPVYANLSSLPVLGTAASTAAANYASSTHNISSATHTFPGGTNVYLRGDGVFATPAGGSSPISTVRTTSLQISTTTSTQAITGLSFAVSSTSSYAFEFCVVYAAAAATTGLRLGARFVTMSTFGANVEIPLTTPGTAGIFHGWITASTLNHRSTFTESSVVATATPLASTWYRSAVYGNCIPAAAGTLDAVFATEVAGSAISTFAGSYGMLTTL